MVAIIFNPQLNIGGRTVFDVMAAASGFRLQSRRDPTDSRALVLDAKRDRLAIDLLDTGEPLTFERVIPQTPGFASRSETGRAYRYREPLRANDGWNTGSLASAGLDAAPLERLVTEVVDAGATQPRALRIHALLIARHGKLVFEDYFFGYSADQTHDTRSAGKTFTTAMLGVAIGHVPRLTLDSKVIDFFPEYPALYAADDPRRQITVRNLVTMNSGLACDDNDDASPGNEDVMQGGSDPDWYAYTLRLPLVSPSGDGKAIYCSAGMNLAGGVIRNATGQWLPAFFDERLARPLGIHRYHMNLSPDLQGYGAGGVQMRPRDQLKLGQLYLSQGRWNGRQVIDRAWVRESTREQSRFDDHAYGLGWHLRSIAGARAYEVYEAEGNGGQMTMVVPALDLVVHVSGGNYGDFPTWRKLLTEVLPKYVLAAVRP